MLDYTKSSGWYWFCDLLKPDGTKCKASKFHCESEEVAKLSQQIHVAKEHNTN